MPREDPATLQQWLLRAAQVPETGLRLVDRSEKERFLEWQELAGSARRVAGGLRRSGVRPGDRVALLFPTGEAFFLAFFGVLAAGAVPVPLYPPVRLNRLQEYQERTSRMLAAVGTRLVLSDSRLASLAGPSIARARPQLGFCTLAELSDAVECFEPGRPEDLGLLQFSSGTTSEPKPVALSQRALVAQVLRLNALWPDTPEIRHSGVSWLPLYHDMGLIGCVLPALERPGVLTLLRPEDFLRKPALWLRAIARFRATISAAPNFAFALAVDRIQDEELAGCDLSCWRHALCGAETVVPETLRRFARRFESYGFRPEALAPVYGLSEAALAVTVPHLGQPPRFERFDRAALAESGWAAPDPEGREMASLGRPLPGFAIEIRDESGRRLGERRVGRVFVSGPSLMEGYFGREEDTREVLRDGWLDTGDLGFLEKGELFLTGRIRDRLKVRGRTYPPGDVEEAVWHLPGLRPGCAVAVTGVPEGAAQEQLFLFVERPRSGPPRPQADLEADCRKAVFEETGLLVDCVVVLPAGSLPRTSSGKLRRAETWLRFQQGRLDSPPAPGLFRLGLEMLRGKLELERAGASREESE